MLIGKIFFFKIEIPIHMKGPSPSDKPCTRIPLLLHSFWEKQLHKDKGSFLVKLHVLRWVPYRLDICTQLYIMIHGKDLSPYVSFLCKSCLPGLLRYQAKIFRKPCLGQFSRISIYQTFVAELHTGRKSNFFWKVVMKDTHIRRQNSQMLRLGN